MECIKPTYVGIHTTSKTGFLVSCTSTSTSTSSGVLTVDDETWRRSTNMSCGCGKMSTVCVSHDQIARITSERFVIRLPISSFPSRKKPSRKRQHGNYYRYRPKSDRYLSGVFVWYSARDSPDKQLRMLILYQIVFWLIFYIPEIKEIRRCNKSIIYCQLNNFQNTILSVGIIRG